MEMEQSNLLSPLINGEPEETSLTDVEDLPGDTLHPGRMTPSRFSRGNSPVCTDTEMCDGSGDEGTKAEAKSDSEDIVLETKNEIVNSTEGYKASEADGEVDPESVYGRHLKNIKRNSQDILDAPEVAQVPTDCESMDDGNDEMSPVESGGEDGLPESYLEQGGDVIDKEEIKPLEATLKSSKTSKVKRKTKTNDKEQISNEEEDVTDIDENDTNSDEDQTVNHPKIRRRRSKKSMKLSKKNKKLRHGDGGHTDSQSISGGDMSDDECEGPKEVLYTDHEDCDHSGDEDDLLPKPVDKDTPFEMPLPHFEITQDGGLMEPEDPIEQVDTDEDDFNIGEEEDQAVLPKRELPDAAASNLNDSEAEDENEQPDTDENDSNIAEEELKELIDEFSTWERSKDTDILEKMECSTATESSIGKWKDAVANIMRSNIAIKQLKSFLPTNMVVDGSADEDYDDAPTDEEDYDEEKKIKEKEENIIAKEDDEENEKTDDEDMVATDDETMMNECDSRRNKNKEMPELSFVENDKGVDAIMTSGDQKKIIDSVTGVQFINDEDEEDTDEEDLKSQEESVAIRIEASTPFTDTESFDGDFRISRPSTPIPHDIQYSVLSSPKREKIFITEDKYGIPQVRIEKIIDDENDADEDTEKELTDTEDMEITLDEALKYFEPHETEENDDTSCHQYCESTQTSSKQRSKVSKDMGPSDIKTDTEELAVPKRRTRKTKKSNKNHLLEEGLTDEEVLSGGCMKDQITLNYPTYSTDNDTNSEDFEVSNMEDIMDDCKSSLETPELVRKLAVKRTETYKEGTHHTTCDVTTEPAEVPKPNAADDPTMITDTEDMEGSMPEEVDGAAKEEVEMHGDSTRVDQTEGVGQDKTEECSKESLLCPNLNAATDVESVDSIENRQP